MKDRDHSKVIPDWVKAKIERVGRSDLGVFLLKVPPNRKNSWERKVRRYLTLNKEKGLKPTSTTVSVKRVPGSDSLVAIQNSGIYGRWYPKDNLKFLLNGLKEIESSHREDWTLKAEIRNLLLSETPDLVKAFGLAKEAIIGTEEDLTTENTDKEVLKEIYGTSQKTPELTGMAYLKHLCDKNELDLRDNPEKANAFYKAVVSQAEKLTNKEIDERIKPFLA